MLLKNMVEKDRVHRRTYTDPAIFEIEMEQIFNKVWTYVGHESQVKNPGDYWTVFVGREPMILVRHKDMSVQVLHNRCPHRGNLICGDRKGHAADGFLCSYHSWHFDTDGQILAIPLQSGYNGTRLDIKGGDANLRKAARVDSYRGFYFASLTTEGPPLMDWIGEAKVAFDDLCDRSPIGEVEVVPNCFRIVQKSNWKIFLENQLDTAHAVVTHESTGRSTTAVEEIMKDRGEAPPMEYHFLSGFNAPVSLWDRTMGTVNYPSGHGFLTGYMSLRPTDPVSMEYEAVMEKHYGKEKTNEILDRNIHHVLMYPGLSVQPTLQQLRAIRPLGVDKTLTEIWHFRLKEAPEAIYRRALAYYYMVNAPSTMVNADDLWNFRKCHEGLSAQGGTDWVSLHRMAGNDDVGADGVIRSRQGTSEIPLRNMMNAWADYMGNREI